VQSIASNNTTEFPVAGSTCTALIPGFSCSFTVTFRPAVAGTRTEAVTVTSTGTGSPQSINLAGTGSAPLPGQLSFASSVSFSAQTVGTTSAGAAILVSNVGAQSVSVQSVASNNPSEFSVAAS